MWIRKTDIKKIVHQHRILFWWFLAFLAVDALSFLAHYIHAIGTVSFLLATLLFIVIATKRYELGVMVGFAELFVGSQGYIFSLQTDAITLSIRYVIFLVLISIALVKLLQPLNRKIISLSFKKGLPLYAFGVIILFAFVSGYLHDYNFGTIFFDGNSYLFLGYALPLSLVASRQHFRDALIKVLLVAAGYVSAKTLLSLFLFTHQSFQFFISDYYQWIRDTRIGELTRAPGGAWRIFMQSQLYLLIAWWVTAVRTFDTPIWCEWKKILYAGLLTSGILISFSRSFWLGLAISIAAVGLWLLLQRKFVAALRLVGIVATSLLLGFAFSYAAINLSLPSIGGGGGATIDVVERLQIQGEAAVSSRWNLLPPLWRAVEESVVIGAGFGSAVTYVSNDPRVRASNPGGVYTTTAFEWGYLDMWLKLGAIGMLVLGSIIWFILRGAWLADRMGMRTLGMVAGLVAMLGVHIGSPYLNHPLGLGWILLLFFLYHFYRNEQFSHNGESK